MGRHVASERINNHVHSLYFCWPAAHTKAPLTPHCPGKIGRVKRETWILKAQRPGDNMKHSSQRGVVVEMVYSKHTQAKLQPQVSHRAKLVNSTVA